MLTGTTQTLHGIHVFNSCCEKQVNGVIDNLVFRSHYIPFLDSPQSKITLQLNKIFHGRPKATPKKYFTEGRRRRTKQNSIQVP